MQTGLAASAAVAMGGAAAAATGTAPAPTAPVRSGRVKQSVCAWCYGGMKLEDLCTMAKGLGIGSVELLDVDQVRVPASLGMTCAVANGPGGITKG
ncbi:MAG: hydroxypyruvate isomerase, partial [Proteobacteria bacterium]|nr:hydroxypyruvate isomerase [Pseudomonadota bacterium]